MLTSEAKTSRVNKKERVCPRLPKYPSSWLPSVFLCDCRSLCWSSAGPSHVGSEAIRVRWRRINTFISTSLSLSLSHLLPPPPQSNASPSSVLDISEHSVQRDSAMWSHYRAKSGALLMSISVHCVFVIRLLFSLLVSLWSIKHMSSSILNVSLMHDLSFAEATSHLVKLPCVSSLFSRTHSHSHYSFFFFFFFFQKHAIHIYLISLGCIRLLDPNLGRSNPARGHELNSWFRVKGIQM